MFLFGRASASDKCPFPTQTQELCLTFNYRRHLGKGGELSLPKECFFIIRTISNKWYSFLKITVTIKKVGVIGNVNIVHCLKELAKFRICDKASVLSNFIYKRCGTLLSTNVLKIAILQTLECYIILKTAHLGIDSKGLTSDWKSIIANMLNILFIPISS